MKFQQNHEALCTSSAILKFYSFPSGGFWDNTWFSHIAWIIKPKIGPPYSAHRHISWCPDRNFGAFLPKSLHSWDPKKWPFFRTLSNRAEIQMGRGLQGAYHCHECFSRNRRFFSKLDHDTKSEKRFLIWWLHSRVLGIVSTMISSIPLDFEYSSRLLLEHSPDRTKKSNDIKPTRMLLDGA